VQGGKKSKPVYSWTNKRMDFHAGRWIDERAFPATVKRSPSFDRPRERLLRLGPAELKTSELLAILVRSGVPGESASQVGERLAARFGDNLQALSLKARGDAKLVSKAMGEAAYCQVMAALELGKRLAAQQTSISGKPRKIRSPGDAFAYRREHFGRLARKAPGGVPCVSSG
jgi:DNA repair protein RadC